MEHCKLQLGCFLVILYIVTIYYRECRRLQQNHRFSIFDGLLWAAMICIVFDGATAYTVNHLESVNDTLNRVLHLFFLLSLDLVIFLLFIYMNSIAAGMPEKKSERVLLCVPFLLNAVVVVMNIRSLQFYEGGLSNYSMGISAYTCFVMVGIYMLLSLVIFMGRWRYIEKHKRANVLMYLLIFIAVTVWQMIYPQTLVSSIGVTMIVLGVYMNLENPSVEELSRYHNEMIMGFATLVENKDGSTGGHIKRSTTYVMLIAEELRRRGYYKDVLTKDYMKNLRRAAPMHDIGKISVPDAILQKPGRLTDEEFDRMKLHTVSGGEIIKETFGHLANEQYTQMAYEVAHCHHEKWNGKGYPEGLKGTQIPLCARIMAIADVFDALSEKRCYRDAMPLDKCFQIIEEGSGKDFDPFLVSLFLKIRDKVEAAYNGIDYKTERGE